MSQPDRFVTYRRADDVGVITIANPPVNVLTRQVREDLLSALDTARADTGARAVVLFGSGRTFSGGYDIGEFGGTLLPPDLNDINAALEGMPKPLVVALSGVVLGGGFEMSLSCHHRVALASTRLGLPEVSLGLLPGAGGTQRLPRLVGLARALEIVVGGKPVGAVTALDWGLLDAIVEAPLLESAIAFARAKAEAGGPLPDLPSRRVEPDPALIADMRARVAAEQPMAFAPQRCIDSVEAATALPLADGLRRERALFELCRASPQSKALIHAFFAEREAARVPDLPAGTAAGPLGRIALIGAGTMGTGIAIACAAAGLPVSLIDRQEEARDRARLQIDRHFAQQAAKGRLERAEADRLAGLVSLHDTLSAAADADLVIEAVFEDLALKQSIFAELARVARPDAVLATNTSTLDVDAIAAASGCADRVLGLHFFSPAHAMRLLEVVRGARTSHRTLATGLALAKRLGKVGVVAGVCFGFIGNRMVETYLAEAYYLLEEGATPQQVDRVMRDQGFAMGPFAMMDLAGNDVGWHIRRQHPEIFRRFGRYPALPDRLCEAGRFGQKAGAGWYDYPRGPRHPEPSPWVAALIETQGAELGLPRRAIADEEIADRLLLALVNEGARLLEEGIALRSSDIDTVYLHGYGFPRLRGGPMFDADARGLPQVLDRLRALAIAHGPRWTPAPLIVRLAAEGLGFRDLRPAAGGA